MRTGFFRCDVRCHDLLLSSLAQELHELIDASDPTFVEAHLLMRFAVGDCPVMHASGVLRLATLVLKSQDYRHERFFRRLPCLEVGVGKDESLVFDDFEIDAPICEVCAIICRPNFP